MTKTLTSNSDSRRTLGRALLAAAVVAVTLGGAAATAPARADGWRDHDRHEWREHEWREHHPYAYGYGYGYAPGYYNYAPPPRVVYAPPPPPSFTVVIPFR
jgi:hypothetical protein